MRDNRNGVERRTFLKSGFLAAAGTAAFGGRALVDAAPADKKITLADGIPTRPFGKTGHTLPVLGMGGSAMVRMFIQAYGTELLSMEERVAMVRYGYDHGVRYFDTARVYGESESIMGQGLKGIRDNVYVATKVHNPDPTKVRESVETSLKQLQMDYIDCVQVHSPAIERVGFEGGMKMHAELVKLRDEGMIRFIGLTTHVAFEDVLKMISTGGFDQVLLAYGYFNKGMDTILSSQNMAYRDMCLAKAHELGMAIVAMKVMGANIFSHNAPNLAPGMDEAKLAKLPPAAIRWVLQDERVSMLNIGASMPSDFDKNLVTLRGDLTFTADDRQALAEFSMQAFGSDLIKEMKIT